MYCHQYYFGGKYDLIQLHRQIIHQNDEKFNETITTSIFYLKFKENNENGMGAHGICFDFYYRPKPSQIGKNSSAAAADAHLAVVDIHKNILMHTCLVFGTNKICQDLPLKYIQ